MLQRALSLQEKWGLGRFRVVNKKAYSILQINLAGQSYSSACDIFELKDVGFFCYLNGTITNLSMNFIFRHCAA